MRMSAKASALESASQPFASSRARYRRVLCRAPRRPKHRADGCCEDHSWLATPQHAPRPPPTQRGGGAMITHRHCMAWSSARVNAVCRHPVRCAASRMHSQYSNMAPPGCRSVGERADGATAWESAYLAVQYPAAAAASKMPREPRSPCRCLQEPRNAGGCRSESKKCGACCHVRQAGWPAPGAATSRERPGGGLV